MHQSYSPRVLALRKELITAIPKIPNTKATVAHMQTFGTHHLILSYLTWKMRQVPARPRKILIWSGGVRSDYFARNRHLLGPFLRKIESGQDLAPHLSNSVNTHGFVMAGAAGNKRNSVIDRTLTKTGLHHFHVGAVTERNPKGRSGILVFAEVRDDEFRVIAISNHNAFKIGSTEWNELLAVSNRYIQSQIPPGMPYMAYPTMSSGHPVGLVRYADFCAERMMSLDAGLDDDAFIDTLYRDNDVAEKHSLERPDNPSFKWHFENLDFGVLEKKTRVFFRFFAAPR